MCDRLLDELIEFTCSSSMLTSVSWIHEAGDRTIKLAHDINSLKGGRNPSTEQF